MSAISARLVDDAGNTLLTMDRQSTGLVLNEIDLGYPTVRTASTPLSGQDGELDVTTYTGGRAITAVVILPRSGVGPLMDTVRGLMHPGRRMWLYVHRDDWPTDRRIRVRGASVAQKSGRLPLTAQLGWAAPGATLQDITLSTVTLNPAASASGGETLPETLPEAFQAGLVPGASIVSVAGSADAPPIIDIYGPCSGPLFRVVGTGAQLSFPNLSIAQGDYLHIDVAARTITLNNDPAQSQFGFLDFGSSSWPLLPHGSPQLVFSPASESPGCVAVVSWYSQWL